MNDLESPPDGADGMALRYRPDGQDDAHRKGAYDYFRDADMVPRLATIAAYLRHFEVESVLDVGCGWADLLGYLEPEVAYLGLDVSETAIAEARARFAGRPEASFHCADFRAWTSPIGALDAVVWAGIARAWTHAGRKGKTEDWLEILDLAERPLKAEGLIVLEMVRPHWDSFSDFVGERYEIVAGCDIDLLRNDHAARRSIRAFHRRAR